MKTLAQLDDYSRYWLTKSLQWADGNWNESLALIRMPFDRKDQRKDADIYSVRDSVWYATGLLMRQAEGDVARALRIIDAIMTYQFDEPSAVYHGTFFRYPGEAHPRENTVVWRGYDPNWREFICTVFIILIKDFDPLLPDELQEKMRHSILLAAEGAYARKVDAEYTNISLMSAFLLDFAGAAFDRTIWCDYALSQANKIYSLFNRYKTYTEYNSPTYYGVDFYALALWREYGSTPLYRTFGAEMEADLWRDTAQFYHADMRNVCGPYDRSYGMDMTDYIASVGLWIAAVLPTEFAPLPDVDQPFEHAGDYYFMPMVALVGVQLPDEVMPHLKAFQGERLLERTIEPQRTVQAWLSDKLMLGAEADHLNPNRSDQFHPATAHWIAPDGSIGWLRTRSANLIQATLQAYELNLSCKDADDYVFEIRVSHISTDMIQPDKWTLPGVTIQLDKALAPISIALDEDIVTLHLKSADGLKLTFTV